MKKQKRQLKKYGIIAIVFCAVFVVTIFVKAAANDAKGWLWGGSNDSVVTSNNTGLGWISLSGATTDAGGGTYAVNIPKTNSAVTGYGWSENMGWIDFNPQVNCTEGSPTATQYKASDCDLPPAAAAYTDIDMTSGKGGVFRSGDKLIGWARFVNIAQATVAPSNAGGWDGWIGIGLGNGYDVSIAADGAISGYGWSELGAIQFIGQAVVDPVVTLALTAPLSQNLLADTETSSNVKVSLTWDITAGAGLSCTQSCVSMSDGDVLNCANWTGSTPGSPKPSDSAVTISNISMPENSVKFIFTCTDKDNVPTSDFVDVEVGCTNKACSSQKCKYDMDEFIRANSGSSCPDSSNTCTVDGNCEEKTVGGWKEVAP